jgi:hypothetical protein
MPLSEFWAGQVYYSSKTNQSLQWIKTMAKNEPEGQAVADQIIRNTYHTHS